jgi:hypothetical protein
VSYTRNIQLLAPAQNAWACQFYQTRFLASLARVLAFPINFSENQKIFLFDSLELAMGLFAHFLWAHP